MTTTHSQNRKSDLPASQALVTRLAPLGAIDVAQRTVELVFTAGAAVQRRRWSWAMDAAIPYEETLVVSREAVNLTRLNAGAPVLDSHRTWGLDSLRAVVDRAWIDGSEGRALVRFPDVGTVDESDRLFRLIEQKIVKNVSCGYTHDKVRIEKPKKEGDIEKWFIERWTPYEVSFVTIGADPDAQVRGKPEGKESQYPIEFIGAAEPVESVRRRMQMRQHGLVR